MIIDYIKARAILSKRRVYEQIKKVGRRSQTERV